MYGEGVDIRRGSVFPPVDWGGLDLGPRFVDCYCSNLMGNFTCGPCH